MYPRINELIGELHERKISSFLVTNAQFPEAIRSLRPVTQLYVSVDAPNKDDLEEVDRPLFRDAWERLRESLVILREKKQRTVARLTLVKGHNEGDISGYAELIALGEPTLVEVKGVTFCGKSDASDLTMANCPWHHEVAGGVEISRCDSSRSDEVVGGLFFDFGAVRTESSVDGVRLTGSSPNSLVDFNTGRGIL